MPTSEQTKNFQDWLMPEVNLLENAIDWFRENMNPEDVFTTTQLEKWAESEGYIKQSEQ